VLDPGERLPVAGILASDVVYNAMMLRMPRTFIVALLACLPAAFAIACGSSSSGTSSTDDGGPGGGGDGSSGGNADGSSTGNTDGGGGSDGASNPDDASGPFCASQSPKPTFCADFDQGAVLSGFDTMSAATVGSLALDTNAPLSAPASLLASITAGMADTSTGRVELLNKAFGTLPTTTVHLRYGVKVAAVDPTGGAQLSEIEIGKAAIVVYVTPTKAYAQERVPTDAGGATYQSYPMSMALTANTWEIVDVLVDLSGHQYTVKIAGAVALTRPLAGTVVPGKVGLALGLAYYSGSTVVASSADFDNVLLEIQ